MGDTPTTQAAETTRVKQKTEDRPPQEREYAPRAFAEGTLFRAAASDDPRTPPQHMARVLRRLTAPQQTTFLLQCQRHYGNAYVQRMVSSRDSEHSSRLEEEAYTQEDPIARQVTALQSGMVPDGVATAHAEQAASLGGPQNVAVQTKPLSVLITPKVQRQKGKDDEEDKPLQSKSGGLLADSFEAGADLETQVNQSKGRGSPLPDSVRAYMEPRFGANFSDVGVHTGSDAIQMNRDVGAHAFTHGSDIYFGAGHSPSNLALTAHELTHVVQQTGRSTTLTQDPPAVQRQEPKNPSKEMVSDPISPTVRTREPTANTGAVIQRDFLDTLGDAADTVSDVASSAADTVSDVAGDAVDAVSDAASDAVDAVSGLIDSAIGELRGAFDAIVGQINGVWDTVKSGVTNAVEGAIREASGFLGGIGAFFGAIGTALSSLDVDSLRAAWAAITGAANAALAGVHGIVAQVTATVDGLWSGLKGLADGLIGGLRSQAEGLIGRLPGPAQGPARSLWSTIEGKLTSTWRTIESGWKSLRDTALKSVNQVVERVEGVVTSIKNSVITTIIETLDQVKGLFTFIKQAIANPDSLIDPIVQEITGRLQGLPDRAKADAQTKAQEQAASGPGAAGAGPVAAQAAPAVAIQRVIQRDAAPAGQPRSTLGVGQVITGCWDFITDKLAKIWANLGATVKEMVIGVLDPRAIWKGLKEDWEHMTKELSTRASRFESIRTDSWDGFWEDLRRFLSNLADFPLIIWRTANAMLGRLSVYIGLAIILGGAVAGAIAAGTGGAIFGSVVPAAGTAAGGGVGILGGAWAGAQAGYALAETVGLVLLVSFAAAEQLSIIKALNDLLWVPQSEEEQNEDFNQATDSTIAIATALLLMAIAFIGVALAKRVWAFVRGLPGRFKPKPKVVEPEPAGPKPVDVPVTKSSKVIICRMCVELKTVPPDILARRAKLPPEMQQFLDDKLNGFVKDPLNPTPAEFDRLRKMMDGIEKANGGDLEAGLKAAKARENPAVKPPFGSEVAELPRLRDAAKQLLAEIDDFVAKNPDRQTIRRAGQRLKNDMDGVLTDMETGKTEATPERIEGFENNLKGVQGEFDAAKAAPPGTQFGVKKSGREIDRISPDGSRWTNDKNFNLFGENDPRVADLEAQALDTIKIAQLPEHAVGGKAPDVEFHFGKGVTPEAAAKLRKVTVGGQSLIVTGPELPLKP